MAWVRSRQPRAKQMRALGISFSALQIYFIHSSFAWYSMKNYIILQYGARTLFPLSVVSNFIFATVLAYATLGARHWIIFDWMVTVTHRSNKNINLFNACLVVLLDRIRCILCHVRFMFWPTYLYSTRVLTCFSLYSFEFYSSREFWKWRCAFQARWN